MSFQAGQRFAGFTENDKSCINSHQKKGHHVMEIPFERRQSQNCIFKPALEY